MPLKQLAVVYVRKMQRLRASVMNTFNPPRHGTFGHRFHTSAPKLNKESTRPVGRGPKKSKTRDPRTWSGSVRYSSRSPNMGLLLGLSGSLVAEASERCCAYMSQRQGSKYITKGNKARACPCEGSRYQSVWPPYLSYTTPLSVRTCVDRVLPQRSN